MAMAVTFGGIAVFMQPVRALQTSTPANNHWYALRNKGSGKYLDVPGGTSADNTPLQSWEWLGGNAQLFRLNNTTTTSGYFTIMPKVNSSLLLNVGNAWNGNGAEITNYHVNPSYPNAQQFKFISNGDGTYRIMPALSTTRVVEVGAYKTANGGKIQLYTWDANNTGGGREFQKWSLEKIRLSTWSNDSSYSKGQYVPMSGRVLAKRNATLDKKFETFAIFTLDQHNVNAVNSYGSDRHLTYELRYERPSQHPQNTDRVEGKNIWIQNTTYSADFDDDNDNPLLDLADQIAGTHLNKARKEEAEVTILEPLTVGKKYIVVCEWVDYRVNYKTSNNMSENAGHIWGQFSISEYSNLMNEYNTVVYSVPEQGNIDLNGYLCYDGNP
jgi:hypothetical protein